MIPNASFRNAVLQVCMMKHLIVKGLELLMRILRGRTARCAKSRLFLAQAEAHFPHSDPPPFTIRKFGERQREMYQNEFWTAHLNFWDKEKLPYLVFHSFESIMHASVGGWLSGVFPG